MINWLHEHVWICTYIIAGLAILTFVLNYVLKWIKKEGHRKKDKSIKMKASHNKKSMVNQSVGDITINVIKDR